MPATDDGADKRVNPRFDMIKLAFIKKGEEARGCLLQDISSTGARVEFVNMPGTLPHPFVIGEKVQILVDDVGEAQGHVVRTTPDGIALAFVDLSDSEQEFVTNLEAALKEE